MKRRVQAAAIFFVAAAMCASVDADESLSIPEIDTHYVQSKHVSQTFKVQVMQPARGRGEKTRFPVVYATDGNATFDALKGISYSIQSTGHDAPRYLLVGIGYPGDSPRAGAVLRGRDLTFPGYPELGVKPFRGAEAFQRFIKEELIPFIDERYPTVPGERTYFGHSAGGGFGLFTLFTQPDLFKNYIISSPGLTYDGRTAAGVEYQNYDFVFDDARKFINSGKSLAGVRLHMSVGTEEEFEPGLIPWQLTSSFYRLSALLKGADIPGLQLSTEVLAGETHMTAWPVAFMHGVKAVLATPASQCDRNVVPSTSFSLSRLSDHTRVLASDEFEGRGLAGPGETKTIEFITRQFARLGLQPAGDAGGWTQRVPLRQIELIEPAALKVTIGPSSLELGNNDTAVFTSFSGKSDVVIQDAPLVFVGYGVHAPEAGWDDFKGVDLRGKIALFLINDPDFESSSPGPFGGRAMTYYGRWTYKYEEAARRGAIGALIIHEDAAAAYGWATVVNSRGVPQFDLIRAEGSESQTLLRGWLRQDAAARLFQKAALDFDRLKQRAQRPDFVPQELHDAHLSVRMQLRVTPVWSHNVIARLRGRERPEENVVYGAHWDHLGLGAPDSTGDRVYHGAVDNATGVAALIEMATSFAAAPPTARSVYFVAFTGEEQGLFGAEHYTLNPPGPLGQTAAMLNMDIMNVEGPACDLAIRGAPNSSLHDAAASVAKAQGRVLVADAHPEAGYFYRADHFPFAKLGVPAISIMPGRDLYDGGLARGQKAYEDYIAHRYHRPADRWSPDWDFRGAALDMEVLYRLGRDIAESSRWPQWRQDAEFKRIRDQSVAALRTTVSIATELGEVIVALDTRHAPETTANFLRYVDGKYYDGGSFHRTVKEKIEVIQAGLPPSRNADKFPPVALERTSVTGLNHRAGTVSMARSGPDTATSEFFICVTDQPELDFGGRRNPDGQGYAAFGEVIAGMDIVREIHRSAAEGQRLTPAIRIKSVERIPAAGASQLIR